MADTFQVIFLIFVNLALIVGGPIVIRRKRVSIGFGRPRPIFTIEIIGTGATIFGIACIVGAVVSIIPTIMFVVSRDAAMLETALTITTGIAFILIVGGFVVGGFVQLFSMDSKEKGQK